MKDKFCTQCGAPLRPDVRSCGQCGAPLSQTAATPAAPTTQQAPPVGWAAPQPQPQPAAWAAPPVAQEPIVGILSSDN